MKKVEKVNIGNFAFTLSEDAYQELKKYLDALNSHYRDKPNGFEIIEGIEERISELFNEKVGGSENVVSMQIVADVIKTLGMPDDFEDSSTTSTNEEKNFIPYPKRLFRNPEGRVLGGVTTGFAAYFGLDVVLVRILFIITLFLFSIIGHGGGFPIGVLIYIILWIIIPEAKSVEQRCMMHGEAPDISHIQKRVKDETERAGRSIKKFGYEKRDTLYQIGMVFVKIVGAFLALIGFVGVLTITFLLLGLEIFEGILPLDLIDFVQLSYSNTIWVKIFGVGVVFLPFLGMLVSGIQMLFSLCGKKYHLGLIIFVLWIISIFGFLTFSLKSFRGYAQSGEHETEQILTSIPDTLYVKYLNGTAMPDKRTMFDAGTHNAMLFWIEGKGDSLKVVTYPSLKIVNISDDIQSKIVSKTEAVAYSNSDANIFAAKNMPKYELKDSLLTIYSDVYTKKNKWKGAVKELEIFLPDTVKVLIVEPLSHNFEKCSNWKFRW